MPLILPLSDQRFYGYAVDVLVYAGDLIGVVLLCLFASSCVYELVTWV